MDYWKMLRWGATALVILVLLAAYLSQSGPATDLAGIEPPQTNAPAPTPAAPAPQQPLNAPTFNTN